MMSYHVANTINQSLRREGLGFKGTCLDGGLGLPVLNRMMSYDVANTVNQSLRRGGWGWPHSCWPKVRTWTRSVSGVGRCRFTLSNPCCKRQELSVLKPNCDVQLSTFASKFNLRRYTVVPTEAPRYGGRRGRCVTQGLTLVHFAAQPEPFRTRNTPCTPPDTP